jgi:hypothetical protein
MDMTYAEALEIVKTHKKLSSSGTETIQEQVHNKITGETTTVTKEIGISIPIISKEKYMQALQIVSSYPLRGL